MKAIRQLTCRCCVLLLGLGTGSLMAKTTPEEAETASVRIFRIVPGADVDKDGKPVLGKDGKPLKTFNIGTGSGFVVSNEGHIVTNQHVVGDFKSPKTELWVAHKEGQRVKLFHVPREGRHWASANQDLAIIQCRDLHCRPLVLSFFEPAKGMEAYTHGYPGIADAGEAMNKFYRHLFNNLLDKKVSDITDFLASDKRLSNLVDPSFSTGHVTRLSTHAGFSEDNSPVIEVVDHTVKEGHGNSGGPLLNPWGEVIGVVGRAMRGKDADRVDWAIRSTELKKALTEFHVPFTAASVPCTEMVIVHGPSQTRIIFAIVASVLVAGAALVLAVLKSKGGRQAAVSYTRIIEAKFKELMGAHGSPDRGDRQSGMGRSQVPGSRSAPAPQPSPAPGETWLLAGRTPDGRSVRLELSETLFARNSNRLVLGRSAELSHLHLNDGSVSRQHAQIRKSDRTFYVADRNSANGTAINGRAITEPLHEMPFRENDTLTFGEIRLVFQKL